MDNEDKTRLERLIALEDRISNGWYPSLDQLCKTFVVKPRTIYADIKLLKERMGIDIRFDRNRNGYYNHNPGKRISLGDVADDDLYLAALGLALIQAHSSKTESTQHDGNGHGNGNGSNGNGNGNSVNGNGARPIANIAEKLLRRASAAPVLPEQLSSFVMLGNPRQQRVKSEVIYAIARAFLTNKCVRLITASGPIECQPCALLVTSDGLQLLAGDESGVSDRGNTKLIALSGVTNCSVMERACTLDRPLVAQEYASNQTAVH